MNMTIYACKLIDTIVYCTSMIPAWTSMRIIDTLRVPMMRINIHGDALSLIVKLIRVRFLELIWPHTEHNRIYGKALLLSTEIGSEEGMPRVIRERQTNFVHSYLRLSENKMRKQHFEFKVETSVT